MNQSGIPLLHVRGEGSVELHDRHQASRRGSKSHCGRFGLRTEWSSIRSTRSSAQGGFGIDFRIGSLGAISKGALDSEGVPVVRILHDGTRDTEVYSRIRVLD